MTTLVSTGQISIIDINDGVSLTASRDIVVVATASDGSGGSYTGCVFTFVVKLGPLDDTANWAFSASADAGISGSMSGATYTATGMSVDSGFITVTATRPGWGNLTKKVCIAKAKAGSSVTGPEGTSSLVAYTVSTVATSDGTAPPQTTGKNSLPASNSSGLASNWTAAAPASVAAGSYLYMTLGTYDPTTNKVTWSVPYWSYGRFAKLSALSADMGAITAGSIDLGSGTTSWHVDAAGNMWIGAATFATAPFRVGNDGAVVATNLRTTTPAGTTILDSTGLKSGFEAPGTKNSDFTNGTLSIGGGNLVFNSSFEQDTDGDGWADNWAVYTGFGTASLVADPASGGGSYAQKVVTQGGVATPRISQLLNRPYVANGQRVTISAWVKCASGLTAYIGAKGYPTASSGSEIATLGGISFPATGAWQRIYQTITATADMYLSITVGMANTPAAGIDFRVDNVQVEIGDVITAYAPSVKEASMMANWGNVAGTPIAALTRAAIGTMHSGGFGDVNFVLNTVAGGTANAGEIQVLGTKFYHPDGTPRTITGMREVITPFEDALVADPFFIVYTDTDPATRFASPNYSAVGTRSPNFFVAVYDLATDKWSQVDNANVRVQFTPLPTDCLVAVCRKYTTTTGSGIDTLSMLTAVNKNLPADGANYTSVSQGAALNDDPGVENVQAWNLGAGISVVTDSTNGAVGRNYLTNPATQNAYARAKRKFPIDPAKTYNLTAMLYAATGNGRSMFVYINFFDTTGASTGNAGWGGTMSGYAYGAAPPAGAWSRQGALIGAGTAKTIPANAVTAEVGIWFQYTGGSTMVEQRAQDLRCEEVTIASKAATDATTALTNAATANAAIADIASDSKMVPSEKLYLRKEWDYVVQEKAGINTTAATYPAAASANTAYNNAFQALGTYLNAGVAYTISTATPPSWLADANLSVTTAIVGATLRANWKAMYDARQTLLNTISIEAGKVAAWSGVTGTGKPADNATVGADASNLQVGLGGKNMIPCDTLPAGNMQFVQYRSVTTFTADGPNYSGPDDTTFGKYAPGKAGSAWMHGSGSPANGTYIDFYINNGNKFNVAPNTKYEASVTLSTHRCSSALLVQFYDSNNNVLAPVWGNWVADTPWSTDNGGSFPVSSAIFTSPANAVSATVSVRQSNLGQADPYTFTSRWYMGEALAAQTTPSPWSPSSNSLTDKLSKTARNVMATGGAIIAGTLATDNYGGWVSGYGVAMTPLGLAAYNSAGSPTIVLDAANGNATFFGALSGATGTFGAVTIGSTCSFGQSAYDTGVGGWIQGGATPKMSLQASNGAKFLCDPTNNILSLTNVSITNPTLDTFSATLAGTSGGSYPNGSAGYGTLTANPVGGKLPYSYRWTLVQVMKSGSAGNMVIDSTTGKSASFSGSGTNASLDYAVTCIVTDANGRTVTLGTEIVANHGTPP